MVRTRMLFSRSHRRGKTSASLRKGMMTLSSGRFMRYRAYTPEAQKNQTQKFTLFSPILDYKVEFTCSRHGGEIGRRVIWLDNTRATRTVFPPKEGLRAFLLRIYLR